MGRGFAIGGIVLLVIGILLIVATIAIQGASTSIAVPAGSADAITSPSTSIGSATYSASWSGAASGTTVYLITGTPSCTGTPAGLVTSGTGASGSLSATINAGTTYYLYACNGGSGEAVTVSYTATGLSLLAVIGVVLLLVGAVLTVLGFRPNRPAVHEPGAVPAGPDGDGDPVQR